MSARKKKMLFKISKKSEKNLFQNIIFAEISNLIFLQVEQQKQEKKIDHEKSKKTFLSDFIFVETSLSVSDSASQQFKNSSRKTVKRSKNSSRKSVK